MAAVMKLAIRESLQVSIPGSNPGSRLYNRRQVAPFGKNQASGQEFDKIYCPR